jgi:fucose permease
LPQRDSFKDYLLETPNYLSMFIFALFFLSLSPILLDISASTGIKIGDFNLVFSFFTIGGALGQLTSIQYNRKFSSLTVLVGSYIILIPVIFILSLAKDLYAFYILYFIGGYFMGVIWLQANNNIMKSRIKNKDRLATLALSFYPIGAFIVPYISSSIVAMGMSWQIIYYILVFLILVTIVLYLTIARKVRNVSFEPDEKISLKEVFANKNKNILFILIAVMLLIYCISETVVATWAPTFFRLERSFNVGDAALIISLFWFGFLLGRVITSMLLGKISVYHLLFILSFIAFLSSISIYFSSSRNLDMIIVFVIGLGYSAIFPLLVSSGGTIYKLGRGVLLTILFTGVNIGISLAPYMTRFLSKFSMTLSISLAPVFMMIFIIINISLIIYSRAINIKK